MPPPDAAEAHRILEDELERGAVLLAEAGTLEELGRAHTELLGRKSRWSEVQRSLGGLGEDGRRAVGRRSNEVRAALDAIHGERKESLESRAEDELLEGDRVDVTLPGRRLRPGSLHPLTIVEQEIVDIFTRMGYRVVEGPEVETDWYNFQALNIGPDHPARTVKDTLYVDLPGRSDLLLRTETSAMQIRTMQAQEPPVFIVSPGRVFRRETSDPSHLPVFQQVEGLAVDEGITFADMKGTLEAFAHEMFGPDTRIRLTPDYFPFVEPGAQLAVSCFICGGDGCRTCQGTGWIELLGCGMVHPAVLENVGYDPERYTGFAFGMGVERVALPRFGIPDIRLLVEGDVRFLEQFAGAAR
ncbi:MAG: phenylalanine--tRNA ligase subunit alpha [Actinomycetota bacterium]